MMKKQELKSILLRSGMSLNIKIAGSISLLFLHLVVARLFDANGTGIFFITLALLAVFGTLSRFGLDESIVKYTAMYRNKADYLSIYRINRYGLQISLIISVIIY